jgi:tRNA-specific 2-thiouridylase
MLDVDLLVAGPATWCGSPPPPRFDGLAQLRAHGTAIPCTVAVETERLVVRLHEPARGVAPGQTVALYQGDVVVGAATIDECTSAVAAQ